MCPQHMQTERNDSILALAEGTIIVISEEDEVFKSFVLKSVCFATDLSRNLFSLLLSNI